MNVMKRYKNKNKIFQQIIGSYLTDADLSAMLLDPTDTPTRILISKLFNHTMDKDKLKDQDVKILLSDIQTLKNLNIWNYDAEEKILKELNKNIEERQMLEQLSDTDKRRYMEMKIEKFLKDIPF